MADRQRLLQALLNLLSNAIKYGPREGAVTIMVALDRQQARIAIDDNGPGITPSLRRRLFAPFDRLGAERGKTEGAGLGLAVSKALMQAMGGDVVLGDKTGPGSRFVLTLPLASAEAAPAADDIDEPNQPTQPAPPAALPADAATTHHLLCVDADPATRMLVATLARRRPHWRISAVADAAAALAQAQADRPDLVLLAAKLDHPAWRALPARVVLLGPAAGSAAGSATTAAAPAARDAGRQPDRLDQPLDIPAFYALLDTTGHTP